MPVNTQPFITRWTLGVLLAAFLATGCSSSAVTAHHTPQNRADVKKLIVKEAARMNMPVSLALAVAHAEYFNLINERQAVTIIKAISSI